MTSTKIPTIGAVLFAFFMFILAGCAPSPGRVEWVPDDGTYRGGFMDEGSIQVNLEFTLENGVVTEASFRHLVGAAPEYNLDTEEEPQRSVVQQYHEALQYLVGKPLLQHLPDLYHPENIVQSEVDGYSGATIRSNKIISAIRDGINRGVYSY